MHVVVVVGILSSWVGSLCWEVAMPQGGVLEDPKASHRPLNCNRMIIVIHVIYDLWF